MPTEIATLDAPATPPALFEGAALGPMPGSPEYREHVERGAVELARVFAESTAGIRRHWAALSAECAKLDVLLKDHRPGYATRHFDVHLHYEGQTRHDYPEKPAVDEIVRRMNVKVWELLIERLGVKSLMSIKRREEFEKQVKAGDVPAVTEEVGVQCTILPPRPEFRRTVA